MKPLHLIVATLAIAIFGFSPLAGAVDLNGSKKQEMERALVGDWQVPENKYKTTITFGFTKQRIFDCQYQDQDKEPEAWSGHWRVRTANTGDVKAYLSARSQSDPGKYMKAVVQTGPRMENFAIEITFDFKGDNSWEWQSKLVKADEESDDMGEDEEDFEDDDEDFEDDDEDFEDDDEDFEDDDEYFEDDEDT
ncbi:MAG: hypothetical protein JEZ11_04510 [Desulfobacterales bacterium]|nr:hypothetical protein [Desulfobacterales bacterium]